MASTNVPTNFTAPHQTTSGSVGNVTYSPGYYVGDFPPSWPYTYPYIYPQITRPAVCPGCGRCATCGKKGC